MKIFIDAGHNYSGADTGARGFGLKEETVSFGIATYLHNLLKDAGHEVKMSRKSVTDNIGTTEAESVSRRAQMSNEWGADLFISIHCNAHNSSARGTETLVYALGSKASDIAAKVQWSIVNKLGTTDRGVKVRPDLVVLKKTSAPALLIETAFIDNEDDAWLLKTRQEDFARAIFEGITGAKAETKAGKTIMSVSNALVQEITPSDFGIMQCKCGKRDVNLPHYVNGGFQATKNTPVGNLAIDGNIITQAKDNADDINLSKKKLTTIYTTKSGDFGITKTDDLTTIPNLRNAISGIPVIVGGKYVNEDAIKSEGYFGNELYDTWHGFLGIRGKKLVHIGAKCGFDEMCWLMVAFGIYDAIKLDGGGSFIEKSGDFMEATNGNRGINNVIFWNE